jgi:hypothetical protein
MYFITPNIYATAVAGSLNYAVYDRDGGQGRARRIGTVKRLSGVKFAYFPAKCSAKFRGKEFDTLKDCLESLC